MKNFALSLYFYIITTKIGCFYEFYIFTKTLLTSMVVVVEDLETKLIYLIYFVEHL